jgi:uncharacterized phage protein (TIGR02220 family)
MIDPDFWSDEKLGMCNRDERLLFMGLISNADDEGYGRGRAKLLKSTIFPYDEDLKSTTVEKMLINLSKLNLVILYKVDGQEFYYLPNFTKHQTINRPTHSKLPKYNNNNNTIILTDDSLITHGGLTPNIKEVNIREDNIKEDNIMCDTKAIIDYLNQKAKTDFKHSSQKTRELIKARLNEKFTLQDFITVIDKKTNEWMNTEWQKFLRPETLFSNKFESYLNQPVHISKNQNCNKAVELYNKYEKEEQAQND